ncbi:hypothetical protein [Thalassoroseus pseudoceratinae]|uniref:hypothetical protein n=1 Tax=Thalassoroseus pseudoceratinae TaxID=2713176 RepID=UPI00141E0E7D|nr:hypothetical protein [Thalassoroseus pseudoceratinae]
MSEWSDCPRGEVGQLVHNLRRRHQKQIWLQSAGVAAGLVLLIGVAGWWFRFDSAPRLTCRDVHNLSGQFVNGELDEQAHQQMMTHFRRCRKCVDYVKREFPNYHSPLLDEDNQNHAARPRFDFRQVAWVHAL